MHKNKAFSLIELMIILVALSMILMAFIPILFKRGEKVSDSKCVGGFKSVRLEFSENGTFNVPIEITSPITVTLIGGGAGGQTATYETKKSTSCSFSQLNLGSSKFYTNFTLNFVGDGANANCSSEPSSAGTSGKYLINQILETSKGSGNIYNCTTTSGSESCSVNNATLTLLDGIKGDSKPSTGELPEFLSGGASPYRSGNYGIGQGCKLDSDNIYQTYGSATSGACQSTYKEVQQALGGNSGAYVKAKTTMVVSGLQCSVIVGSGGAAGEVTTISQNTSITCGDNVKYTALGAGQTGGDDNTGFQVITSSTSQSAPSLDTSKISGGKGGDVTTDGTTIYSNGGLGGCEDATTSFECSKPNGTSGSKGSGGGGSSCSENGCGVAGQGGDGFVIVEYQMKCK